MNRLRLAALLTALFANAVARADPPPSEPPPTPPAPTPPAPPRARQYARGSVTLFASPELAVPVSSSGRFLVDVGGRVALGPGFVVQPRLGAGFGFSALSLGVELSVRPGLGVGWSFPVSATVALTPTAGYDLFALTPVESGRVLLYHRVALDFPVTIVLGNAVLEPYVFGGVTFFQGQPDPSVGLGLRAGIDLVAARRPAPVAPAPVAPAPAPAPAVPAPASAPPPEPTPAPEPVAADAGALAPPSRLLSRPCGAGSTAP